MNKEKLAQALHLIAEALVDDDGDEGEKPAKRSKHNPRPAEVVEDWRTKPLEAKSGDETNVYRILLAHVGGVHKPFDVHEMTKHRDKCPFKHCSLQRLMLELKEFEENKLAAPIDDLRQKWILLSMNQAT